MILEISKISEFFTLFTYFSRETTQVLGEVLKLSISSRFSITYSKNIKYEPPDLADP